MNDIHLYIPDKSRFEILIRGKLIEGKNKATLTLRSADGTINKFDVITK